MLHFLAPSAGKGNGGASASAGIRVSSSRRYACNVLGFYIQYNASITPPGHQQQEYKLAETETLSRPLRPGLQDALPNGVWSCIKVIITFLNHNISGRLKGYRQHARDLRTLLLLVGSDSSSRSSPTHQLLLVLVSGWSSQRTAGVLADCVQGAGVPGAAEWTASDSQTAP